MPNASKRLLIWTVAIAAMAVGMALPLRSGTAFADVAQPAVSLTGAVVERGRKRPGLPSGPSPAPDPAPVEPQNPSFEAVRPGPPPVEAEVVTAVDAKIQALVAEETGDADVATMVRTRKWFNLLRNAVIFIFVFWVGAVIAVMAF